MRERSQRMAVLRGAARALAVLSAAGVVLAVLYVSAAPIWTADFWWHLAMGQVHAQEGIVLAADPLSHAARGAPTPHEWLFQVALQALHAAGGFHGLRLLQGLAVLAVLALAFSLLRRASASLTAASMGLVVFAVLSWYRVAQLRPDLWSIACMLLLHRLLFEPEEGPSPGRIAAGAGVLLVWANAHSLFLVGLILIGAALAGALVQEAAGRWLPGPGAGTRPRRLAVALGAGTLATLANPRGPEAHLTFLDASSGTELWRIADEWTPFRPFSWSHDPGGMSWLTWLTTDVLLLAFLAAVLGAVVSLLHRADRERLAHTQPVLLALGAASVVAMLAGQRFLWLGIFPLLWLLRVLRGPALLRGPAAQWALAGTAAALALSFPGLGGVDSVGRHLPEGRAYWARPWLAAGQPAHAVRFLQQTGVEGNLFNRYSHGGFLGYWLAPRLRTFVDGRLNFGSEVLHEYFSILSKAPFRGVERWQDVLERRRVDLFLGSGAPTGVSPRSPRTFTASHLEGDPHWLLISRSLVHALYLKRDARNRSNLERVTRWYREQGVPFDPGQGLDPAAVIDARPDWAVAHGLLPGAGLPALESADTRRRFRALDLMGFVYTLLGAYEAAVAVDTRAAALRPGARAARRRLAYGQLRLGRANEALGTARELLRIAPDDPRSQALAALATQARRHPRAEGPPAPLERAFLQAPVVSQGAVNRLDRRLALPPLASPSRLPP